MRSWLLAVISIVPVLSAQETAPAPSGIYKSVVRIEVASQIPDYETPWNAGRFSGGIGTGFIIGKNQFLTNAHVISDAARIMLNVHGSSKKYAAKVEFVAHDCDLALLSVEDFSDFENFPVFTFGDVPVLESQVRVIGYPIGGDRLSVTRGVVSRIDFSSYSHSRADSHLVVQIDAAINPGNSGGPVVQDGKVVGVAFQGLSQADNTGYMIPTPVIRRFLKDIEDGSYDSYVDLSASTFPLFNPAMRAAFGLPDDEKGVLITTVLPSGSSDGVLQPGDILLSLGGKDVDSGGMITLDGEQVDMNEIVERKFAGDKLPVTYLRDGKKHDGEIVLKTLPEGRLYAIQYEKKPRYILFAGLVFQPLDTNLLGSVKIDDLNVRRLYADYLTEGGFQKRPDIIVLTRIESDPLTSQMDEFTGYALDKINGVEVRDLRHAYELLHPEEKPEFFVIELFGASRPLVVPSAEVEAAERRVSLNYNIKTPFNLED